MGENKKGARTLQVLLLICAGALLVIVITLASTIYDAQSARVARATQMSLGTCGMPEAQFKVLPSNAQLAMRDQCDPKPDAELRQ